jgi:two-component system, chemotaxis family, chemotaxis protein CheY
VGKKLLVVEDSAAMRQLIIASLSDLPQLEITECQSGFEALKLLPRSRYDMVLTDINMPDINGLELIGFLKSNPETREIPIVIITTEAANRDQVKGLSLGANEYIVKPFEPSKLKEVVGRYLQIELPQ